MIHFLQRDERRYLVVRVPCGYRPEIILFLGEDSRPFDIIKEEAKQAIAMLAEKGHTSVQMWADELANILNYQRV